MHSTTKKKGSLEVIVGCMSSGKSEELIRRLRRASIAKQGTIVFKPAHDVRTDAVTIASRDGKKHGAVTVVKTAEILALVTSEHRVVGLDEAQFFDEGIVAVANALVDRGVRVIVAGLDTDFRGEPFGMIPQLLAIADTVTKLQAVCVRCGETAIRSQITVAPPSADITSPDFVGGDEKYEARCRNCHEVPR
jgi:thymidine kinase